MPQRRRGRSWMTGAGPAAGGAGGRRARLQACDHSPAAALAAAAAAPVAQVGPQPLCSIHAHDKPQLECAAGRWGRAAQESECAALALAPHGQGGLLPWCPHSGTCGPALRTGTCAPEAPAGPAAQAAQHSRQGRGMVGQLRNTATPTRLPPPGRLPAPAGLLSSPSPAPLACLVVHVVGMVSEVLWGQAERVPRPRRVTEPHAGAVKVGQQACVAQGGVAAARVERGGRGPRARRARQRTRPRCCR